MADTTLDLLIETQVELLERYDGVFTRLETVAEQKIQEILNAGGGLTEEEINNLKQDILNDVIQQLGDVDIDSITQQINDLVDQKLQEIEEAGEIAVIKKPVITNPENGVTDFNGVIEASEYETSDLFQGEHQSSDWLFSKNEDFSTIEEDMSSYDDTENLTSYQINNIEPLTTYYVKVRYKSDNHVSKWSDAIQLTTPEAYIETPTITVAEHSNPTDGVNLLATGSEFTVVNDTDNHVSTDWILKDNQENILWQSLNDTENLTSVMIPADNFPYPGEYKIEARYNGNIYQSQFGSLVFNTADVFTSSTLLDILGDGSCVALYELEGNANDTGGVYHGQETGTVTYVDDGYIGKAVKSSNDSQIVINNLPFDENTEAVTVSAWVKWNGNNSVMSFGWDLYDIYFHNGYFGFNTDNNDIYGISSSGFANTWRHLTVEFRKGQYGKM